MRENVRISFIFLGGFLRIPSSFWQSDLAIIFLKIKVKNEFVQQQQAEQSKPLCTG